MRIASLRQIILSITTLLLASCTSQHPAVVTVTPTPRPIIEITSFPSTFQIDDIDIEFSGYEVEKDNFIIMICFDPPTRENWSFADTAFSMQNLIIRETRISVRGNVDNADGFYCGELVYPAHLILSPGKAKLSVGHLVNSFQGDCDRAQKNLDEAKTGIVIKCDPSFNNGLGFLILKKPMSMKYEEAVFKAREAFTEILPVNWRFSFFVEEP